MRKILFIIDKIELKYFEFNNLVTNFWLIKEFLERNREVYIATTSMLLLHGQKAFSNCYKCFVKNNNIYYDKNLNKKEIDSFDLVMFRPDPPVDIDYINATYIFDFCKTRVINSPKAIRNFNEKLHSLYFFEQMSDSMITSSENEIENFLNTHHQIVIKPLNKCFGSGVMFLHNNDCNKKTIINTLTNNQTTMVMIQKFIPEVKNGDHRVLTLGNQVLPYCIKKLPGNNDFKFNTHSDQYLIKSELSIDELKHFQNVANELSKMGIIMSGLDVINGKIIEINVTSPCYFIKEINNIYNVNLEKTICDHLLKTNLLTL